MADWLAAVNDRLRAASPEQLREAAVRAARLAAERVPPQDPVVAAAAAELGRSGPGVPDELDAACEALDRRALEADDDEDAFVAAHVAFAVRAALDPDPRQAALDAVYEAAIALADAPELEAVVDGLLPEAQPARAGWYEALEPALPQLGDDRLRAVSAALAEAMLERHPVEGKAVSRALRAARKGNTGPSIPRLRLRRELDRLQAETRGDAAAGSRASAVFALWSALRSVPLEGARTAAFSAWTELGDDPGVRRRLADLGVLPEA